MILLCDCGSTKAEWVVLDGNDVAQRFITNGFNPNFTDNATIKEIAYSAKETIDNHDVNKIFFYGSGCGSEANKIKVAMFFAMVFNINDIEVYPDSLGACHALFGRNKGVACILGTGSNACYYDGECITKSMVSLGYVIGDEGSGCHIGKRIVHDYFYKIMPDDLLAKFDEKYHIDRETFLKKVYQDEAPSRYLAEFARFAYENIDNQYVKDIISGCFEEFLSSFRLERNEEERNGEILSLRNQSNAKAKKGFIRQANAFASSGLDSARNDKIGFVGSIAFAFREILLQVLEKHNLRCVKILKNPMDGLIEYYKNAIV